jgi:hypothetical protein
MPRVLRADARASASRSRIAFSSGEKRDFFFARKKIRALATRSARRRRAPPRRLRRRRPEIIFAKWLTSKNHVISFRPADTTCGSESLRTGRQFATP